MEMNSPYIGGVTFAGGLLKVEVSKAQNGFIAMVDNHRWVFSSYSEMAEWVEKSLNGGVVWQGQG